MGPPAASVLGLTPQPYQRSSAGSDSLRAAPTIWAVPLLSSAVVLLPLAVTAAPMRYPCNPDATLSALSWLATCLLRHSVYSTNPLPGCGRASPRTISHPVLSYA